MFESQPTNKDLINKLEDVLKEDISREQFNIWAYKWVQNLDNRSNLSLDENQLHEYFIFLLGIDLEMEPDIYFYDNRHIQEWIEKIKHGIQLS
ncbi:hypothetical protein [Priestia megaterium]|uniref:hypothetical protein n=1 Tax=Priestia megaterium TaxID=1404 RepID=UPI001C52CA7D|nr:hypothetical protein [Priestia megaterium]MBW0933483.1 hypothetical protein [Priestia megaterium]